jgi:hypothetical protein
VRAAKQARGQVRNAQHAHGNAASRFADDRHLVRIAAKRRSVFPDPLEGGDRVEKAEVAGDVRGRLGGVQLKSGDTVDSLTRNSTGSRTTVSWLS